MKDKNIVNNNKIVFLVINLILDVVYLTIYPKLIWASDMSFAGIFLSIVIPCVILYFTCPRTKIGMKVPLIFTGIFMVIYYILQKESFVQNIMRSVDMRLNSPTFTEMEFVRMMTEARNVESYANIGIAFGIILFVSGTGIIFKIIHRKNKLIGTNEKVLSVESVEKKVVETTKNYVVCIFDTATHALRKEMKDVDVTKFPPAKFADNDTYYAIETFRDGKKVRVYYTKENWDKQCQVEIAEEKI